MITDLSQWTPRERPTNEPIRGRYVAIEPWDLARFGEQLWNTFGGTATNEMLFHFGWPKMENWQDLASILDGLNEAGEFITCVFCDPQTGKAVGMSSYMRVDTANGVCEVGAVAHGPAMARSPMSTEAQYLMASRVFDDLEYRRYEWKLNNPNEASHRAAQRLGFTFEGVFRQHQVKPYGNRDTAWYAMLDHEWPSRKIAFEAWLEPQNFSKEGRQIRTLEDLRGKQQ